VPLDYYVLLTRNWYECYQKYLSQVPQFGKAQGWASAEVNLWAGSRRYGD